jgi:hypothetical protein
MYLAFKINEVNKMRNKILLIAAAIMVMGLAVAAVAYSRTSVGSHAAAACCAGDKCPMKNKDAATGEAKAHENCDCCKDGAESCPMMKKGADGAAAMKSGHGECCPMMKKGETSAVSMKSDHGDSCPMMKKGEAHAAMHGDATPVEMKHEAAAGDQMGCCCPCCSKEKTAAPAV